MDSSSSPMQFLKSNSDLGYHSWHGVSSNPSSSSSSSQGSYFRRQGSARGSMRKILPPVPDMDAQLSLSAKMIDKKTCTPKGNHSYAPFFLEYSLLAEYNLLQKQKLPGVYIIPSAISPLKWYGVMFVRSGNYQGGIFRFQIIIPDNYPDGDTPKLYFEHKLYHPLIDPFSFELDLKRVFRKWRRNINHIWQIVNYMRKVFYKKIDITNPSDSEAAELYESNVNEFKTKVNACIEEWKLRLYEIDPEISQDDPHYLVFQPFNSEIHNGFKNAMNEFEKIENESSDNSRSYFDDAQRGLSFMEPSSLKVFSRATPNHSPAS
ncbi:AKT-interacting protein isoform X2 [Lepeophtheirus salmonis]|uniref:AKT-interacting protein isoform X2 n=1 Tax=Lepeophtheirus salmonis TaxID=72036 RepID=UPI001AE50B0B|nr:AKT-interacting protein-like isoform X2 [Lepeophtheirus salmonis]